MVVVRLVKCPGHLIAPVKSGSMKVQRALFDVLKEFVRAVLVVHKKVAAKKCEHLILLLKSSNAP